MVAPVGSPFGGEPYKKAVTTAPPSRATVAIHCQLLLVVIDALALRALAGSLIESLIRLLLGLVDGMCVVVRFY
jgi:hypothetical protein